MIFLNDTPMVDPNVPYQGYILPEDAQPLTDVPVDPNVYYAGSELPAQRVTPIGLITDLSNNPSSIALGVNGVYITLPASTQIILKGEKIIAESQILDGVSVFEHVSRKPYEIDFDVLIWNSSMNAPFPQDVINNIWNNLWVPNTILQLVNTYLNGLGVLQVIVKSINPTPKLGSTSVVLKLKLYENQVGQSIIMSS